jgi:hypothetical protein
MTILRNVNHSFSVKGSLLLLLLFLLPHFSSAQIAGCTDPQSVNFNPNAVINDGSCAYAITIHNPPFAFELPETVRETSGLLFINDKLWTFNDSGGTAELFAIDTATAQVVQTVSISNAFNIDWEGIALDDDYIYIGDFGNNAGVRKDLVIYRISKHGIPLTGNASLSAEKISFSYPDQNTFERSRTHNFDCEAMITAGDNIFLFSKNRGDNKTKLYRLPKNPGVYVAELIETFDSKGLVTGADINEDENEIILTGYTNKTYLPFIWLLFDFRDYDFFSGNKRRIDLVNLTTTQVEGVTYLNKDQAVISAERSPTFSARVFHISLEQWTNRLSKSSNRKISKSLELILAEKLVHNNTLRIKIDKKMKNLVRVNISDTEGKILFSEAVNQKVNKEEDYFEVKTDNLQPGNYTVTAFTKRRHYSTIFIQP